MSTLRYSRQQQVRHFGIESQAKLTDACVVIVGLGGLGSPVSLFLAGAGVGKLILVDDDVVSLSNLHRQILYQEQDVEKSKVTIAKRRLGALNSDIEIEAIRAPLGPDNAHSIVSKATVVVDAADNFLVSYILSDLCFANNKPLVTASVLTTHGYLGVFCGGPQKRAPSMRAVFPTPSKSAANCDTAGVTGPSVGVIASYQAQEVLKVILGDDTQLLGKLMTLDLWDYSQHIIDFSTAREPETFAPIVWIDDLNDDDLVLDVRTVAEVKRQPLNWPSLNIPNTELRFRFGELSSKKRIICVCASGHRALGSANELLTNGFTKVCVTSVPH